MIRLSCRVSDSLDWDMAFPEEGPLFFRFDLGLEAPFFPLDDEMHFQSLSIALQKFTTEIYPKFQERISGAVLYSGTADFSAFFQWSERQKENFKEWSEGRPVLNEAHQKRLFCADAFAHYFQMLAHRLPDEMPLYVFLDGAGVGSIAERHQLISKERFEHFLIAAKGLPFGNHLVWEGETFRELQDKPSLALCFPEDKMCTENILNLLNEKIASMQNPFRILPEAFLTEDWEGVDVFHVLKEPLTPQGERKLKGFLATGGEVNWI